MPDSTPRTLEQLASTVASPTLLEKELANECFQNQTNLNKSVTDARILARLARVRMDIADEKPDDLPFRAQWLEAARVAAEGAIEINPEEGLGHKWLSIILGLLDPHMPDTTKKIENGYKIKTHADIASEKLPEDAGVQLVLAGFCMGVARLSWFERQAAKLLYATPPKSDFNEALKHAERACEIMEKESNRKDWPDGVTVKAAADCGECLMELKRKEDALVWYRKALEAKEKSGADAKLKGEIRKKTGLV